MKDPYENMTPDERRLAAQASADAFEKDRVPLMIVGALVVLTTVLVFASKATGIGQQHIRERDVVASVEMRVVDAPEGVIEFIDPDTNDLIWSVAPGEYGFVRTAVRALAFRREIVGADAFSPIVL
ncbi:MAG: photosynthetic complex assembly protein PuhC, partial [Pseudomonadota bacterium]